MKEASKGIPAVLTVVAVSAGWPVSIYGSEANAAVPTCFNRRATIVGTEGPDNISGNPTKSDVIVALGGNDSIHTGTGDYPTGSDPEDFICAGPGADLVKAGPGADRILGGDGNDELEGSFGSDYIDGNVGDDLVLDEDSEYESVPDTLHGSQGNDYVHGDYGADTLTGGAGNDTLVEGSCVHSSKLFGGPGNDKLYSTQGPWDPCGNYGPADRIWGDAGFDIAEAGPRDIVRTVERVRRY